MDLKRLLVEDVCPQTAEAKGDDLGGTLGEELDVLLGDGDTVAARHDVFVGGVLRLEALDLDLPDLLEVRPGDLPVFGVAWKSSVIT